MRPFYLVLMVLWGALAFYTGHVITQHGWGLLAQFLGAMGEWSWQGQFNLDFTMLLFLSACWTAWRNGFSAVGMALALLAFLGGAGFLLPYLTYLAWKHGGDAAAILLGVNAKDRTA